MALYSFDGSMICYVNGVLFRVDTPLQYNGNLEASGDASKSSPIGKIFYMFIYCAQLNTWSSQVNCYKKNCLLMHPNKGHIGVISRGKAGESGRRRIGTVELFNMGYARQHFLPLPFSTLRRLALETISSPFPVPGNSVLNKGKKVHFCSAVMSRVHLPYPNSFSLGH